MNGNLLWCDLEMTGLDAVRHRIIEIALVITDRDLAIKPGSFEAAIRTTPAMLARMSRQVRKMHESSGLLVRVHDSKVTLDKAEKVALALVKRHFRKGEAILAGNSIATDRRFLARWMPRLEGFLHYRMVDVTAVKELAGRWYPGMPRMTKSENHTAMADVLESIEELRYYRKRIFK